MFTPKRIQWLGLAACLIALGGCGDSETPAADATLAEEPETTEAPDTEETEETEVETPELTAGINEITYEQEIDGEMVARRILLHVLEDIENLPAETTLPVYFFFHGNGGAAEDGIDFVGPLVNQGLGVGVYPDGYKESWNLGREESTADDVAFVGEIFEILESFPKVNVDLAFAMGFSNGAGMTHKLALETTHFRGIATMASDLVEENLVGGAIPEETAPVAVMQIHGTDDPMCPYEGGPGVGGHVFVSVEESAALWAKVNDCPEVPEIIETKDGNELTKYAGCGENEVASYAIIGAGHGIPPNTEGGLPFLIWEFFRINNPGIQIQ